MKKTCVLLCLQPFVGLLSEQIRELVPESQAYMDLLAFERKLDQTIMRKRVDIQEALKRPMKVTTKADQVWLTALFLLPFLLLIPVILYALVPAAKAETEALHFQHLQPRQT